MTNILLVPVHLDALALGRDTLVLEATADFARLPYTNGARDVNSDTPNLSEAVASQEFQDENLNLKAGIHLHWAMPDGLTRGAQGDNGTQFPLVPNRWLVRRSRAGDSGARVYEKSWVVESDYLYPEGAGAQTGSVSYPHHPEAEKSEKVEHQPFRYAGRKMPRDAWAEGADASDEYVEGLTAVGYGEPSFAAFYPNCHSVFGLFDEDYTDDDTPAGLRYDLLGWYADPSKDHLNTFVAGLRAGTTVVLTAADIKESVENSLGWTVELEGKSFPEQLVCYASLTFEPKTGQDEKDDEKDDEDDVKGIAVANTSTEALSAYLAERVDRAHKADVEDQLEAILLSSRLADRRLDVGPKFEEARHEKGFAAVAGGTLWTVTLENQAEGAADAERADKQSQVTLPAELAHKLNSLNSRQAAFDAALQELESRRRQLFSDWYKYMLSAYPPEGSRDDYPDADEVRNFVELKVLARLNAAKEAAGALWLTADKAGNVTAADAGDSRPDSLAALLAADLNALASDIVEQNRQVSATQAVFTLRQSPGPRYYRPTDPVALVVGAAVKPSERHGQDGRLRDDGLLNCQLFKTEDEGTSVPALFDELYARVEELRLAEDKESIAFGTWTEPPWNPFLMEWQAEVFPVESGGNLDPETGDYSASYITDNYTLSENSVDLSALPGRGYVKKAAAVYSGRSILTPHALDQLRQKLEAYLQEQILPDYLKARGLDAPEDPAGYFHDNRDAILTWYEDTNCDDPAAATCQIAGAFRLLDAPDFYALSQSLGGFNEALLMHKQTMQLDIADPLGFDDERPFSDAVCEAVGTSNTSAPRPLNDFLPIRAGALKLLRLRLVDTFGRARELDCANIVTTEKLKDAEGPYPLMLPPRLAQAARLNFRWLSAEGDDAEMNDHPATSPVCGWLLPNNLDGSLMVYDGAGAALGSLDVEAAWRPAPGSLAAVGTVGEIPNPHLRKLVGHVKDYGQAFVSDFLTALDNALENIEPESFAQHQGLALLVGRPVALVRASLNLELQGEPAVHQGWNHFRQDMKRYRREDTAFTHVRFPVRLGEYRQLNDGLAGYWVEEGDGYAGDIFYAPQSERIEDPHIRTHADDEEDPLVVYQSVAAPPQVVSMLVDPRGTVHACSGIAPTKSIEIPPDQYTDALRAIEVTFLTAPVLTEQGLVRLPLAPEPDFKWSWLSKVGGAWAEVSTAGTLQKRVVQETFGADADALWAVLKDKDVGWISETGAETATVTPKDLRKAKTLGEAWAAQEPAVELMLAATYIGQVVTQATFSGRQSLIEGWLKLSNDTAKQ